MRGIPGTLNDSRSSQVNRAPLGRRLMMPRMNGGISGTVVTWADATTWVAGTTTGLTIGTATTQKLGFYNATPVVQQATTGTGATGFTAGGPSNTVHADATFTGGIGTKAYTISDIVRALKNLGLLAAS